MALNDITQKIAEAAQERAKEIVSEARAQEREIVDAATQTCADTAAAREAEQKEEFARFERMEMSQARRQARTLRAAARRAVLDRAFNDVLQMLRDDASAMRSFLAERIASVPASDIRAIRVAPAHREIAAELCASHGITIPCTEDEAVPDGMIVETETVTYDLTLTRAAEDARPRMDAAGITAMTV